MLLQAVVDELEGWPGRNRKESHQVHLDRCEGQNL
jgi:hypothetical protein